MIQRSLGARRAAPGALARRSEKRDRALDLAGAVNETHELGIIVNETHELGIIANETHDLGLRMGHLSRSAIVAIHVRRASIVVACAVTACGGDEKKGASPAAPLDAGGDAHAVDASPDAVDAPAGAAGGGAGDAAATDATDAALLADDTLRTDGGFFKDGAGRVVLLRGVNVAGNSKVPPFLPTMGDSDLDRLAEWGMNVVRLVFTWEAYEPSRDQYDTAYLDALTGVARAAWARGLYVIVDFHQDGFSRFSSQGCGDGFPQWAIPSGVAPDVPDNTGSCADWATKMALDPDMHASFGAFYGDDEGVRTKYLALWSNLAAHFAEVDGVIGYDPLNEPWGFEKSELGPLYEDVAVAIRTEHPEAILFIEGHVSTNGGINQTDLGEPSFVNFAYAPHFYESLALIGHVWSGIPTATDVGFATMTSKANQWNVPLFVGEFGIGATATLGLEYVDLQYERLNDHLASGAYWNYTPRWSPAAKDGWNGEDLSLVDDQGNPRPTFRARPYPRRVAGKPTSLVVRHDTTPAALELEWDHDPTLGSTELFVTGTTIEPTGPSLACAPVDVNVVECSSVEAGAMRVVVR